MVLLDMDSTHNFINSIVATTIRLPVTSAPSLNVNVANGDCVMCTRCAPAVDICNGHDVFSIDCYAILPEGYDVVLSVDFLRTLGPIL